MIEIEKRIITDFNNLVAEKVRDNELKVRADEIKKDSFFISQIAIDSRLDFNITKDMKFIQEDLIFTTGVLFALIPFINDPVNESKIINGKRGATYFQNMYDSLYSMYASFCYEKLYNFWDRIGDKLAVKFPEEFNKQRNITFTYVIEKIKEIEPEDSNINWLYDFRNSDFKEFNDRRRKVVHYEQVETKYMELILDNVFEMDKIEEIYNEKASLPSFFKKHIEFTNEGIVNTYKFIKNNS